MPRPRKFFAASLLSILMLVLTTDAVSAKKPPQVAPPELPPVRYEVQYFEVLGGQVNYVRAVNNVSQVVGSFNDDISGQQRAFLYDPYDVLMNPSGSDVGIAVDLNKLDFDAGYEVPEGFVLKHAADINDSGDIVGSMMHESTGQGRGFVLDRYRTAGIGAGNKDL